MAVWLQGIETAVPETVYTQQESAARVAGWMTDPRERRLSTMAHKASGIEKRHSVITSFEDDFFERDEAGELVEPTTAERNARFEAAAVPLACKVAQQLCEAHPTARETITHLITVSCTGCFTPGPDIHIIQQCGLRNSVQRYHLGFMGCCAAISAIHMAQQFCEADEQAVVMVVCLELCTLHLKPNGGRDALLANLLFADGAAACLISSRPDRRPAYRLGRRNSHLVGDSADEMAWTIGDHGFDMVLSSYVPRLIGSQIESLVAAALRDEPIDATDIDLWAVHPGGKTIVDAVEKALDLSPDQLRASREILRNYGNMSSVTLLFVLRNLLETVPHDRRVCAMAFGPGLTVELHQMELVTGAGS